MVLHLVLMKARSMAQMTIKDSVHSTAVRMVLDLAQMTSLYWAEKKAHLMAQMMGLHFALH